MPSRVGTASSLLGNSVPGFYSHRSLCRHQLWHGRLGAAAWKWPSTYVARALGVVARARNMTALARKDRQQAFPQPQSDSLS